jgi:hypothetical protein
LDKLDDLTLDYLLVERGIANSIENVFIQTRQDKINFIRSYTHSELKIADSNKN